MGGVPRKIGDITRTSYRKLLRIGWTQKVTNTDLYSRIKLIGRKLRLLYAECIAAEELKS